MWLALQVGFGVISVLLSAILAIMICLTMIDNYKLPCVPKSDDGKDTIIMTCRVPKEASSEDQQAAINVSI